MGQTFAVQSLMSLNRGELNHIENIAELFLNNNQESDTVVIRNTPFFGGKSAQTIETFPKQSAFEGMRRSEFKNFWITRVQWSVGTYIESLRFTFADGTVSPKLGGRAFTHSCSLDSPIKKIETSYR